MQKFDLIVIGGGPGGYLCAERAGKAGLRPALIEKRALGGTCLNEGCIPTKSLLYCAKQYQAALHGADYGVTAENVSFDHAKVVARKDGVVRTLVRGVGAAMKAHGVTVFSAEGKILGKDGENFTVSAGGEVLSAPRLVIATGSSAAVPPIPGVKEGLVSGFVMTNREILALQTQPKSLVCIGGGVIGLEMACYFASIGTKVTVVEMMPKIAGNTDPEICDLLMKTYRKQGMEFCLGAKVEAVTGAGVVYSDAAGQHTALCDRVLLSAGRRADVTGLGTEAIGLALERGAVVTDARMRTNVPGVWAIGDCNGKLMLAHTAYREAEVAVNDMLGKRTASTTPSSPPSSTPRRRSPASAKRSRARRKRVSTCRSSRRRWPSPAGIWRRTRRATASASCSTTGKTAASWACTWSALTLRRSSTARP